MINNIGKILVYFITLFLKDVSKLPNFYFKKEI